MITNDNINSHELIGLRVTIQSSSMASIRNICGKIIYETKKMLIMENDKGVKAIPKTTSTGNEGRASVWRLLYKWF